MNSNINNWYPHNYITGSTKLQYEATDSFQNEPHTDTSFPNQIYLICMWLVSTFLVSLSPYTKICFIK